MTTMKRPKEWMTSAEHDAWLKETGQYEAVLERQRQHRQELEKRRAVRDAALEPVEADLHAAGAPSISAMFSQTPPPNRHKAIPILLMHLEKPYPRDARSVIASALQCPEARPHCLNLIRLFREERDEWIKSQLGCAISVIADANVIDDVIALVRDKTQGPSRVALLDTLNKSKDPRGKQTILDLADDPDLREEIKAIRKKWERNAIKRAQKAAQKNPTRH